MSLVSAVKERIDATVPALAGRVEEVADLAALIGQGALPQRSPAAYVIPLGFDAGAPTAITGLYRQPLAEVAAVVLIVEAVGDARAQRALATIDTLQAALLATLAGWTPAGATDAVAARRGRLISVANGSVIYQIDFGLSTQLRIATP